MSLPLNAIARLTAIESNLVEAADLVNVFEMYGYSRENAAPNFWLSPAQDAQGQRPMIEVVDGGETFVIYSGSVENAKCVNYIARQAGWLSCSVIAADHEVFEMVMEGMLQVDVDSTRSSVVDEGKPDSSNALAVAVPGQVGQAAEVSAPRLEPAEPTAELAVDQVEPMAATPRQTVPDIVLDASSEEVLRDMAEDHARINELTFKLSDVEAALSASEERAQELAVENDRLIERLSTRAPAQFAASGVDESSSVRGLLAVVEAHLLKLLDTSKLREHELAKDLAKQGYEIELKLVRKVAA